MTDREALACAPIAMAVLMAGLLWCVPRGWAARTAIVGAVATSGLAVAGATGALVDARHPHAGNWIAIDAAGGLLVGVIGVVGLISVLASPAYCRR